MPSNSLFQAVSRHLCSMRPASQDETAAVKGMVPTEEFLWGWGHDGSTVWKSHRSGLEVASFCVATAVRELAAWGVLCLKIT